MRHTRIIHAYGKSEEFVYLSHPLSVALCKIIVDGNDVNAFLVNGFEISRQSRNQSLTFTGTHLGNSALIKHNAAYKLHAEMPHSQHSVARLSHSGKRLRQQRVKAFARLMSFDVTLSTRLEFFICHSLEFVFQRLYLVYYLVDFFEFSIIMAGKNFSK